MKLCLLLVMTMTAACVVTTPTPAPTITPGPPSTAEPTPGNLEVEILDESDPSVSGLTFQEIPVVHVVDTSKVGLMVTSNGWKIWLHKPDDTKMGTHHFHLVGGPGGGIFHSENSPGPDEFRVYLKLQNVRVKVTSEVLKVSTVGGFKLYFRRVANEDRWEVAVPATP